MDWKTLSQDDCCRALYEVGGALRRMGKYDLAKRSEKIADKLYPGEIKPLPIIPRTTSA